ncbi:MAG: hypothetical protein JNK25_02320 [Phycisphaerae bacterium]|nr:hypothetical protein [Phycisphaerae bacterium]
MSNEQADAGKAEGSKDVSPYELEPVPFAPKIREEPTPSKAGRIGDAGLLSDFDEDADFDKDPEVERAVKGPPKTEPSSAEAGPIFVKPGMGAEQSVALVGAGVLLAGIIAAGVTSTRPWYAAGASAGYGAVLHTVTGVAAVAVAAHLASMRMGNLPLAGARMFVAVSLFTLGFHLNIPITGRFDEVLLAAALYLGALWVLFRWRAEQLFIVSTIHAGLVLAVWFAGVLARWGATAASPATS